MRGRSGSGCDSHAAVSLKASWQHRCVVWHTARALHTIRGSVSVSPADAERPRALEGTLPSSIVTLQKKVDRTYGGDFLSDPYSHGLVSKRGCCRRCWDAVAAKSGLTRPYLQRLLEERKAPQDNCAIITSEEVCNSHCNDYNAAIRAAARRCGRPGDDILPASVSRADWRQEVERSRRQ